MVVRFNFERGKSCRYSTYTYSKQLGEFLRVGEGGGHGPPRPPAKSATDDDQKQGKACFKSAAIYESNSERIGKSVNYCRSYV